MFDLESSFISSCSRQSIGKNPASIIKKGRLEFLNTLQCCQGYI